MSLDMLSHAAEQGITDVVNTVHYQHSKVETEDISFKRIKKEINTLQTELKQYNKDLILKPSALFITKIDAQPDKPI